MSKFPVLLSVALLMAGCVPPAFQVLPNGQIAWRGNKGCIEALNRGYVPKYAGKVGVDACLEVQRIDLAIMREKELKQARQTAAWDKFIRDRERRQAKESREKQERLLEDIKEQNERIERSLRRSRRSRY